MPLPLPRLSAHTTREFAFQIVTIIAGILIALTLDGVLERSRDRALVRDAVAAQSEMRENQRDVRETRPSLEQHLKQLEAILQLSEDFLAKGKSDAKAEVGLSTPSLNSASWQTADRTGALALMDFDDIREYSEVYNLQTLVVDSQTQAIARVSGISALVFGLTREGRSAEGERADLEALRSRALDALGAMYVHLELVKQLDEDYTNALER